MPEPQPGEMTLEEKYAKLFHLARLLILELNGNGSNYGKVRIRDLRAELEI